jgi:hypothetical protein
MVGTDDDDDDDVTCKCCGAIFGCDSNSLFLNIQAYINSLIWVSLKSQLLHILVVTWKATKNGYYF